MMHERVSECECECECESESVLWAQYPDVLAPDRAVRTVASLEETKAESIARMVDGTTFDLGRKSQWLSLVSKDLWG